MAEKEGKKLVVEFEKVLATAVEQKKILIVEGKVNFDTSEADVVD